MLADRFDATYMQGTWLDLHDEHVGCSPVQRLLPRLRSVSRGRLRNVRGPPYLQRKQASLMRSTLHPKLDM